MDGIARSTYNYLTSNAFWRRDQIAEEIQQERNDLLTPSQKVQMGVFTALKNLPRALALSALVGGVVSQFVLDRSVEECVKKMPQPIEKRGWYQSVFQIGVKDPLLEEFVFRGIIQTGLSLFENSRHQTLSALGSLRNRLGISGSIFAGFHLNNLFTPCLPTSFGLKQTIGLLLNMQQSILFERGGIIASTAAHITNNLSPFAISILVEKALQLAVPGPSPKGLCINPDLLESNPFFEAASQTQYPLCYS